MDNKIVIIAGNIGAGKTTLVRRLSEKLGWHASFEKVEDNAYLKDFYKDMKRWSFHLQIYFLLHRYKAYKEIMSLEEPAFMDRSLEEDLEIFSYVLNRDGNLSNRDYQTYREMFEEMTANLRPPDLLIYLQGNLNTLMHRISLRNRSMEKGIDPKYLARLNRAYDRWIKKVQKRDEYRVKVVDINKIDIETDLFTFNDIVSELEKL
jgi:deoxyadenosine/deoxycytidine kinase